MTPILISDLAGFLRLRLVVRQNITWPVSRKTTNVNMSTFHVMPQSELLPSSKGTIRKSCDQKRPHLLINLLHAWYAFTHKIFPIFDVNLKSHTQPTLLVFYFLLRCTDSDILRIFLKNERVKTMTSVAGQTRWRLLEA